jgi:hypothetical protein
VRPSTPDSTSSSASDSTDHPQPQSLGPQKHLPDETTLPPHRTISKITKKPGKPTSITWHEQMGHLNDETLHHLLSNYEGMPVTTRVHCETCIKATLTQKFQRKYPGTRADKPFTRIHSDVCGPFPFPSLTGCLYYVIFIDDYSHYATVYYLKTKSGTAVRNSWHNYQAWVRTQHRQKCNLARRGQRPCRAYPSSVVGLGKCFLAYP